MKLLLTSSGISNISIENELKNIVGRNFDGLKVLFCTTASNYEGGEMNDWLIKDLEKLISLGFKIDICDINGISKDNFLPRFEWADIFYFEGGNTQWLRKCIRNSGLEEHLIELLETRIWIGASAGSCVLCPTICNSCQDLFDENIKGLPINGLNFVNFQFIPHLNNHYFPKIKIDNLQNASKNLLEIDGKKLYIVDDNGAVVINNESVKVVSEGIWYEI
jgi:dipeptidase E